MLLIGTNDSNFERIETDDDLWVHIHMHIAQFLITTTNNICRWIREREWTKKKKYVKFCLRIATEYFQIKYKWRVDDVRTFVFFFCVCICFCCYLKNENDWTWTCIKALFFFFLFSKKPMILSVRDLLMLSKITYNVIIKSNKMKFKHLKIVV